MRKKPVVAIDGPSGVGKSTVAKKVARILGYELIDTGALYRAVALIGQQRGIDWQDADALAKMAGTLAFSFDSKGNLAVDGTPLNDAIRTPEMALGASEVAAHEEVRAALLEVQRELGSGGGVVLEGRDIGTRVFLDAEVKFFLNADSKIRARRRFEELVSKGADITLAQIETEQAKRDKRDRTRAISPLQKANDALEIVCDDMNAQEVADYMINQINSNFPLTSN